MFVYIISAFFTLGLLWISTNSVELKNRNKLSAIVCGFPLFMIAAIRQGIGTDYYTYIEMLELYFSHGFRGKVEPGFFWLNVFIDYFFENPQWLFVVCSAMIVFLIFYYVLESSINPVFSIYLYITLTFYLSSFNTMRQHIACAICLIALVFLNKKSYLKFFVLVGIAVLFHYTAIIFFSVYVLAKIKIKPRLATVIIIITYVLSPIIGNIANTLMSKSIYALYANLEGERTISIASYLGIAVQLAILFLGYLYINFNDEKNRLYFNIQLISTCITVLGSFIPLVSRVKWYFALSEIVYIPMVISNINDRYRKRIISMGCVACFAVYYWVVIKVTGSYGVLPYKSIIEW